MRLKLPTLIKQMNALRKIWRLLGPESAEVEEGSSVRARRTFELWYRNLMVGRLKEEPGGWMFAYTEDFQEQESVKALADFPNKTKSYQFEELWPFFASRIPSLEQPKVRRQLREENIDSKDTGALLRRYGKQSISNSFILREG